MNAMKGIRTVKIIAAAGGLFWFDINRKLKLLISRVHGTKKVELPLEKDIEVPKWIHPKTKWKAIQRAKYRASALRWNLEVAIFLFGILAIIVILGNQGVGIWILAPIAVFSLTMVWTVGWKQAKKRIKFMLMKSWTNFPMNGKTIIKSFVLTQVQNRRRSLKIMKEYLEYVGKHYRNVVYLYTLLCEGKQTRLIRFYQILPAEPIMIIYSG